MSDVTPADLRANPFRVAVTHDDHSEWLKDQKEAA